jgi:hypothetical protein
VTEPSNGLPLGATPKTDVERGTQFNMWDGSLVFSNFGSGEIWDYIEPSVTALRDMLDQDGAASKLEMALTLPVRRAGWSIKGYPGDEAIAEDVTDKLTRPGIDGGMLTPMQEVVSQMTSAFTYRRSYHEKVFTRVGNDITYEKIAYRPPESCIMLRDPDNGDLRGFKQWKYNEPDMVEITRPYAMVYVHGTHREPIRGYSDLRVVWKNYELKQKVKFLWFTFLESLSLPRIIVKGTSPESAKQAAQAIAALRNAGVAGVPSSWMDGDPTVLDVGGQGAAEYQNAITYLDADSANSILASFTDLSKNASMAGAGSYALAKNDTDFFTDMLSAYATEMGLCLTNEVVADLVRYNYGTGQKVPRFEIGALSGDDVATSMDLLKTVAVATQVNLPDEFVNDLVMEVAKFLNMDLDKVQASIADRAAKLEQAAQDARQAAMAKVQAAADVGTKVVQQAAQQNGTSPSAQGGAK